MATLLSALKIIAVILPTVISLVQAVELPGTDGQGATKKDLVLGIVSTAIGEFAEEIGLPADKVNGIVGRVIDLIVGAFNKMGVFKKATA